MLTTTPLGYFAHWTLLGAAVRLEDFRGRRKFYQEQRHEDALSRLPRPGPEEHPDGGTQRAP